MRTPMPLLLMSSVASSGAVKTPARVVPGAGGPVHREQPVEARACSCGHHGADDFFRSRLWSAAGGGGRRAGGAQSGSCAWRCEACLSASATCGGTSILVVSFASGSDNTPVFAESRQCRLAGDLFAGFGQGICLSWHMNHHQIHERERRTRPTIALRSNDGL
jgi:hypothetical protein